MAFFDPSPAAGSIPEQHPLCSAHVARQTARVNPATPPASASQRWPASIHEGHIEPWWWRKTGAQPNGKRFVTADRALARLCRKRVQPEPSAPCTWCRAPYVPALNCRRQLRRTTQGTDRSSIPRAFYTMLPAIMQTPRKLFQRGRRVRGSLQAVTGKRLTGVAHRAVTGHRVTLPHPCKS